MQGARFNLPACPRHARFKMVLIANDARCKVQHASSSPHHSSATFHNPIRYTKQGQRATSCMALMVYSGIRTRVARMRAEYHARKKRLRDPNPGRSDQSRAPCSQELPPPGFEPGSLG